MLEKYVLLHNAGGAPSLVQPLADLLGGNCKSPELLGHGKNVGEGKSYDVASIANDLVSKVDVSGSTLIGLNYGAVIAIEIALRGDIDLKRLVLIEPPICMKKWLIVELEKHIHDLSTMDSAAYAKDLVEGILQSKNAEYKKIAEEAFIQTPQHVQQEVYRGLISWDKKYKSTHRVIDVPTLLIQTAHPFAKDTDLQSKFSHISYARFPNSGPWVTLDAPEELANYINKKAHPQRG